MFCRTLVLLGPINLCSSFRKTALSSARRLCNRLFLSAPGSRHVMGKATLLFVCLCACNSGIYFRERSRKENDHARQWAGELLCYLGLLNICFQLSDRDTHWVTWLFKQQENLSAVSQEVSSAVFFPTILNGWFTFTQTIVILFYQLPNKSNCCVATIGAFSGIAKMFARLVASYPRKKKADFWLGDL